METELEHILISAHKNEMIAFLDSHPEYFEEAIELAISDKQPYAWRSAWLLWSCLEENDKRIKPYIQKIINTITTKKDSHQRELIKILLEMKLNDDQEGHVFNICMTIWEKININPSVRFAALKFIVKTAKKHPDLSNEITFITQNQYLESLSPGIKRSIYRMIKEISIESY